MRSRSAMARRCWHDRQREYRRGRWPVRGAQARAWSQVPPPEEYALRLLVRFCAEQDVHRLSELTPALVDDFLGSRPRSRPRSFNHLLGVVRCLLDWAVSQQLLEVSPLRARRRRVTADRIPFIFDRTQARRLLDAAAALPDNSRAPQRGATSRTIFALCYGLGLLAGEVCGLRLGDIDTHRSLLVVRGRVRTRRCSPSTAAAVSIRAQPTRRSIASSAVLLVRHADHAEWLQTLEGTPQEASGTAPTSSRTSRVRAELSQGLARGWCEESRE